MMRSNALWMLVIGLVAPFAAAAPPTPAQLQEKFKAGDYRGTLAGISQALALKPGSDEGYDRYELLMLKGECLVQLNSASYAVHAFDDAREATDDAAKKAQARANELIFRSAAGLKYSPRSGADRAAIDVKAPESRKKAMLALRADLLAQNKARIDTAKRAANLEPLLTLLPALRQIAVLEIGATGQFEQIKPLLVEMGTHARDLITKELKVCRIHVEQVNATANEIYGNDDFVGRRGLFTKERQDLAAQADYIRQIETTGREGRRIAQLLGGAVDAWERIVTDSTDLATRIDAILRRVD